jgi:hypothetical protein
VIWLTVPWMTLWSRAHGGGKPHLPLGLDAWLLCAPYLLFFPVIGWWIVPAYLGAVLGIRLGHGRGFTYNEPFKIGSEPEKVEWLIDKSLPVKTQKILIMFLTGWAVTLTLGLILNIYGHILAGLIIYASGMLKAVAYFLPRTDWAELLRGFFLGCGVVAAFLVI